MEEKVHTLINTILMLGEQEIYGKVTSIHHKEGLIKHLSNITTIMIKIKPGIFNKFTKVMILSYLEGVKMTHTPLGGERSVNLNFVNKRVLNSEIIKKPVIKLEIN